MHNTMNKLFTYLLALCTATCLYGCSEELEEMTSTEASPSNIVSRSIPESFSCGTLEVLAEWDFIMVIIDTNSLQSK